jgi:hypothetical protein
MKVNEVAGHDFDSTASAAGKCAVVVMLVFVAIVAPGQSGAAPDAIGADAVWMPPTGLRDALHRACDSEPQKFGDCFLRQMQAAGAAPAAVEFGRRTHEQGYLRAFRKTGRVDVVYAEYPFRANENQLCFLVNGDPPMIDVDDASRVDRADLAGNPDWAAIARAHPKVAIFPGDRFHTSSPRASPRQDGGQRFVVAYSLRDGCHACAIVGAAHLAFDFDAGGRLLAMKVLSVEPAPVRNP